MGASNQRIFRRKVAQDVENELFTLQTELLNLEKLDIPELKDLRALSFTKLKQLRELVQSLSVTIGRINSSMESFGQDRSFGDTRVRINNTTTVDTFKQLHLENDGRNRG